jgi:hypothetical protein
MNVVVFTHQNLKDMPIYDWVDCRRHRVFVMSDADAQSGPAPDCFQDCGYEQINLYTNYINNGAIDADVLALVVPSRYLTPVLPKCSCTMETDEPLYDRLRSLVEGTLEALPSPPSFSFHAEVYHTPDDRLLVNEIASRTGGGKISSVVEIISGVNLNHLSVVAQIDPRAAERKLREARPSFACAGLSLISPKNAELVAVPDGCPFSWVSDFTVYVPADYTANENAAEKFAAGVVSGS